MTVVERSAGTHIAFRSHRKENLNTLEHVRACQLGRNIFLSPTLQSRQRASACVLHGFR